MEQWTERQLRACLHWLNDQWNEPDRSDHYMMQVAARVAMQGSKKRVKLDKFKIPFKFQRRGGPITQEAAQAQMAASKSFWGGLMSRPVQRPANKKPATAEVPLDGN